MALYGIYQFIARIYLLPLADLFFEDHMVEGFNWTNTVYGFPILFQRSNAIFREPSFFSQFLAVAILFQIVAFLQNKKSKKTLFFIVLDLISMVLTFSGTGPLVLFVSITLYYIINAKKYSMYSVLKTASVLIIGVLVLLNLPIGDHFVGRIDELLNPRQDAMSGYMRFIAGYDLTKLVWRDSLLFGCGIGNGRTVLWQHQLILANNIDNGLYKVSIELGLIGVFLWLFFVYNTYISKESEYKKILSLALFPLMICSETFLSNYYWFFLFITNIKQNDC